MVPKLGFDRLRSHLPNLHNISSNQTELVEDSQVPASVPDDLPREVTRTHNN